MSDPALVDAVRARLAVGKPVRRTLAGGGRLHIDRPLPFLCVYRTPADRSDPGTAELVKSQASYLIASGDPAGHAELAGLVAGVVATLADACGACLLLELWTRASPAAGTPRVTIHTGSGDRSPTTIEVLAEALRSMSLPGGALAVDVAAGGDAGPPGRLPLLPPELAARGACLEVGLELPPVHRSATAVYPVVLRALARELARALQQSFFEFTRVQTPARPEHYQMMGRRRLVRAVRLADAALAEIEASFDFLLDVSPVNTEAAWQEFCGAGKVRAPVLRYRMLAVDPELVKRRLYQLPLERLEDPVLALLLRDKRRELDRQLGLLEDRDSARFLSGSIQLYGAADDVLLAEAEAILAALPPSAEPDRGARCGATALAARARAELDHYRRSYAPLASAVKLRADVASLIVSHGDLLVPETLAVPARRVDALLQHEIGTHVVTYTNGLAQPLRVFAAGLAGYEALQEGLAMFAEHLVGGLDRDRLRLIAARVIAVRRVIEQVSLPDLVAELCERHGFAARTAFGVALRVFRGGGLTKDAIYLRGLIQLLDYLAADGALEPLLVGKLAIEQVLLVEELLRREILTPPRLRPRWLDGPGAAARLERARGGLRPVDLVELRSCS